MAITLHGTDGIDSPDFNATGSVVPANGMYLPAANTLSWATNSTRNMTLDSSGKLGIETTLPQAYLHIQDGSGSANGTMWLGNSTYYGTIQHDSAVTGANIYTVATASGGGHIFKRGTTEQARIDSSGNLLVGKTSATLGTIGFFASPAGFCQFTVNNDASLFANRLGSDGAVAKFYRATVDVGSITVTGSATAYNTSSDQRLKENIVDAPSAIDSVNSIKIRSFDWKSDGSHVDYGYIAQELLEVAPEAVSVPADPDEMMGVDFGKLTPRIIKALQELTQRLEALEAK